MLSLCPAVLGICITAATSPVATDNTFCVVTDVSIVPYCIQGFTLTISSVVYYHPLQCSWYINIIKLLLSPWTSQHNISQMIVALFFYLKFTKLLSFLNICHISWYFWRSGSVIEVCKQKKKTYHSENYLQPKYCSSNQRLKVSKPIAFLKSEIQRWLNARNIQASINDDTANTYSSTQINDWLLKNVLKYS